MSSVATPLQATPNAQASVIEMIYAANSVMREVARTRGGINFCMCGTFVGQVEDSLAHYPHCKVARYYASVEQVKQAVL